MFNKQLRIEAVGPLP